MAWVPLPQDRRRREVTKLAWSHIARMAIVRTEHFLSDSWACIGLCSHALKPLPGRHERACALHCGSRSLRTVTQPWHTGSLPSQKAWLADMLSRFSARDKFLEKYSSTLGIPSQGCIYDYWSEWSKMVAPIVLLLRKLRWENRLSSQVQDQPMQQSKTPSQIKKDCQSEPCAILVNNGNWNKSLAIMSSNHSDPSITFNSSPCLEGSHLPKRAMLAGYFPCCQLPWTSFPSQPTVVADLTPAFPLY